MRRFLIFIAALVLFVGCEPTLSSSEYETYEQAQDMIEKGWVPANLPDNVTNIVQTHDLDKNIGNGMFSLEQEYVLPFMFALNPVEKKEVLLKETLEVKGWDQEVVSKKIEDETLRLGMAAGVIYAVDEDGLVYYWIN